MTSFADWRSGPNNDGPKAIFDRMADDEERLLRVYRHLSGKKRNERKASRFLNAKRSPFLSLDEKSLLELEDDLAVYRCLLKTEEEKCRLYEEAAQRETDEETRALLRRVAEEEAGELQQLENILDFTNAPNEYLAWGEFSNLDEFHNFGRYEDNRRCRHTA